jgi:hypothetical protein
MQSAYFDNTTSPAMPISKLEAAQRQLDCAIRLFFENEDMAAVHTLSRAAFRLLYDIYPKRLSDGFEKHLEELIVKRRGWKHFNRVANFFKHADQDADAELPDFHIIEVQTGIGIACILYGRIARKMCVPSICGCTS